jgi:signal transduction histidine kinase
MLGAKVNIDGHPLFGWPVKADRTATGVAGWVAAAICLMSGIAVAVAVRRPAFVVDPGARAAIETTITLSAILSAGLFVANFKHRRRLSDLLLLCALTAVAVTDFIYCALPVLIGGSTLESGGAARLACELVVALAFAVAALESDQTIPGPRRRLVALAVAAGTVMVLLAELCEQVTKARWAASSLHDVGLAGAIHHPVALAIQFASAAVLIVSTFGFLRRRAGGLGGCGLLAGAAFLLAVARLQYLAMPAVATDWVTPREGLRVAAYALLLASAWRQYAATRRTQADEAITSEHERIARDLHDGLAQDLACIVAQSQRLGSAMGAEHPLTIAARHALAAMRGAIADLTASAAPTTEDALRLIAAELEHRYRVEVDVQIEPAMALSLECCLKPDQREHIVRIARQAIVNAALHGAARRVEVALVVNGRELHLRVSDDGTGIKDAKRTGFGLRTMQARAASLGGELRAHPGAAGGTELELLVT